VFDLLGAAVIWTVLKNKPISELEAETVIPPASAVHN